MNDDLLRCLIMILINGQKPGSDAAKKFFMRALKSSEEKVHYKVPSKQQHISAPQMHVGVQTVTICNMEVLDRLNAENKTTYFDMLNQNKDDDSSDDEEEYYD